MSVATAFTAALAGALALASPASALRTCGSLDQPECAEEPPPGVVLELGDRENPHGLQPIADRPSASKLLWPRVRGHEQYGFNAISAGVEGTTIEDEAMLHEQMGASLARITADWGAIQYFPNAEEGRTWNYGYRLDRQYREYVRRGVRPLLTIVKAPRRFTRNAETRANSRVVGCEHSDACHNPPTAEHLDDLAAFAGDLARRYPLAAGVEVWNEPNLSNPFWGGEPIDPEHYAAMLDAVHDGVKAERPALPVIGGALALVNETSSDASGYERMGLRNFLARMLRAGAAADMDAVSYHPYFGSYPSHHPTLGQQDRSLYNRMIDADNQVIGGYQDAGVVRSDRVVATELGASTTDGFTEERQSAWLRLRYWLWDTDHPYLELPVDAAFFQKAVEEVNPPYGQVHKTGYGFVRPKDEQGRFFPKQVYCTFRVEFGGFSDCPEFLTAAG